MTQQLVINLRCCCSARRATQTCQRAACGSQAV